MPEVVRTRVMVDLTPDEIALMRIDLESDWGSHLDDVSDKTIVNAWVTLKLGESR